MCRSKQSDAPSQRPINGCAPRVAPVQPQSLDFNGRLAHACTWVTIGRTRRVIGCTATALDQARARAPNVTTGRIAKSTWLVTKLSLVTSREHLELHFYDRMRPLNLDLTLPSVRSFSRCAPSSKALCQSTSATIGPRHRVFDHLLPLAFGQQDRDRATAHHWPEAQVQHAVLRLVSSSELPDFTNFATLN
jgi:hypothetical protein